MKKYGYWRAIYLSFYSRDLYRDVVNNWGAGVFLYLILLLMLTWASMLITIQPAIMKGSQVLIDKFTPQLPEMLTIKNGEAMTSKNKPYFIKDPDNKELIAIIDTSGKYKSIENTQAKVLLTKTQIISSDNHNVIKIQSIPKDLTIEITPAVVKENSLKFVGYGWIVLFPLCVFFSFIYRVVQALIYSIFGKLFSLASSSALSYKNIFKLSMVAITPAMIVTTIFEWVEFDFHFQLLFYFVLAMGYLIFAIRSNKENV